MIQTDIDSSDVLLAEWEIYELIIFHLVGNAVKYSSHGEIITVVLSLQHDSFSDQIIPQVTLNTVVKNRGAGMSEEKMNNIRQVLSDKSNPK